VSIFQPTAQSSLPTPAIQSSAPLNRIMAKWETPLRSLAHFGSGWLVGDDAGVVRAIDEHGHEQWQFHVGDAVNTLFGADIDNDGNVEAIVGSEDKHVYLLNCDGSERWRRKFALQEDSYGLYTKQAEIRRVYADDLNADGVLEIYVTPDNTYLHALNPDGSERWKTKIWIGLFTEYSAIDLYNEGKRVIVGGMPTNTCASVVQVIDHNGNYVDLYVNDGWTSSLSSVWVGDIDNDGKYEILAGTNRGWLRVFNARPAPLGRPIPPFIVDVTLGNFQWAEPRDRIRWARHLGEDVRRVIAFSGLVIGAAENGFIVAFDPDGNQQWFVQASSGITHLIAHDGRCYAFSRNGEVLVIDISGNILSRSRVSGRPVAVEAAANGCLVASTDGALYEVI
jgi:hypothetical protein